MFGTCLTIYIVFVHIVITGSHVYISVLTTVIGVEQVSERIGV